MDDDREREPTAWDLAMQAHEAKLTVGVWVRISAGECPHGSEEANGLSGRIIRICRQNGEHVDTGIFVYVLDNERGFHLDHPYEVWVPGASITWWCNAAELTPLEPATYERKQLHPADTTLWGWLDPSDIR